MYIIFCVSCKLNKIDCKLTRLPFTRLFYYFILPYAYLKLTLSISFTYFRYYENMLHKNTSHCKILISVPEEGWFGQPKYSIHLQKNHSTLCRFLLLYSSFFLCEANRSLLIQPSRIIVPVARLSLVTNSTRKRDLLARYSLWLPYLSFPRKRSVCVPVNLCILNLTFNLWDI